MPRSVTYCNVSQICHIIYLSSMFIRYLSVDGERELSSCFRTHSWDPYGGKCARASLCAPLWNWQFEKELYIDFFLIFLTFANLFFLIVSVKWLVENKIRDLWMSGEKFFFWCVFLIFSRAGRSIVHVEALWQGLCSN